MKTLLKSVIKGNVKSNKDLAKKVAKYLMSGEFGGGFGSTNKAYVSGDNLVVKDISTGTGDHRLGQLTKDWSTVGTVGKHLRDELGIATLDLVSSDKVTKKTGETTITLVLAVN